VEAARFCAVLADRAGITTYLDLDLRPTDWSHPSAYGLTLRSVFPLVDVVLGTEEEFFAALAPDPEPVMTGGAVPASEHDTLEALLSGLVTMGTVQTLILKRGPEGATVITADERVDVPGFPVEVVNTVGAGDAFAAGLIRSRLAGWDWYRSVRFANACGAIAVTRHGCSRAFPREPEVLAFVDEHGGL
jgi:5-dehydro-2-deoxygluconokinase